MIARCEVKILLLGVTVRHHSASLVLPNNYPRDRNFNPHLITIKDYYNIIEQRPKSDSEDMAGRLAYESPRDKTNKLTCAPSKDSDQPGHPPSLIRAFAVHSMVAKDPSFLHADSEDSDQAGRMPRLI